MAMPLSIRAERTGYSARFAGCLEWKQVLTVCAFMVPRPALTEHLLGVRACSWRCCRVWQARCCAQTYLVSNFVDMLYARFLSVLAHAGPWLEEEQQRTALVAGQAFLKAYTWLAAWAHDSGRNLFKLRPKLRPSVSLGGLNLGNLFVI